MISGLKQKENVQELLTIDEEILRFTQNDSGSPELCGDFLLQPLTIILLFVCCIFDAPKVQKRAWLIFVSLKFALFPEMQRPTPKREEEGPAGKTKDKNIGRSTTQGTQA